MKEKIEWVQVTEVNDIAENLRKKYPDFLDHVNTDKMIAWAASNKNRPSGKKKLYELKAIPEPECFTNERRYVLKMFMSDWSNFTEQQKQWLVFEAMSRISPERDDKILPLDYSGMFFILQTAGVGWENNKGLPDLLEDRVEFQIEEDEEPEVV